MKMTATHLAALRETITPLDGEARRELYRQGNYPRADKTKDVDMRYRWDLFYIATFRCRNWPVGAYLDSHIDTALRSIVPPLTESGCSDD